MDARNGRENTIMNRSILIRQQSFLAAFAALLGTIACAGELPDSDEASNEGAESASERAADDEFAEEQVGGVGQELTAAAPKMQRVENTVQIANNSGASPSVQCPAGSIVTSGGIRASNSWLNIYGNLKLNNGWQAYVTNQGNDTSVTVYANCLQNTAGYVTEASATATIPNGTSYFAKAKCPSGSIRTGGGFLQGVATGITTWGSTWSGAESWTVYTVNNAGRDWGVTAKAVCLHGVTGRIVTTGKVVTIEPGKHATAEAPCSSGTLTVGGGFLSSLSSHWYRSLMTTTGTWLVRARNDGTSRTTLTQENLCLTLD